METKINLSQRERDLCIMVFGAWKDLGYNKGVFEDFVIRHTKPHTITPPITAEEFRAAVGRMPEQDDLDRCNCDSVGDVGHTACGWNEEKNLPNWLSK